jgi:hypothetical protein
MENWRLYINPQLIPRRIVEFSNCRNHSLIFPRPESNLVKARIKKVLNHLYKNPDGRKVSGKGEGGGQGINF